VLVFRNLNSSNCSAKSGLSQQPLKLLRTVSDQLVSFRLILEQFQSQYSHQASQVIVCCSQTVRQCLKLQQSSKTHCCQKFHQLSLPLQSSLAVEEQTSQQIDVGVSLTVPQSSQPVEQPSPQQIAQVDVGLSLTELTVDKAPAGLIPFGSLAVVPHRERRATNRKRISPPSYQLTSPKHIAFITSKKTQVTQQKKPDRGASKKTKRRKQSVQTERRNPGVRHPTIQTEKKSRRTAKNRSPKSNTNQTTAVSSSSVACPVCDVAEKSPEDIHLWIACHVCETWYHEPCAEQRGIFNDDNFTCQSCYNKPNK